MRPVRFVISLLAMFALSRYEFVIAGSSTESAIVRVDKRISETQSNNADFSANSIAGLYNLKGVSGSNQDYHGTCEIIYDGRKKYRIVWRINNQTRTAGATLDNDILTAEWVKGGYTYKMPFYVRENGILVGTYQHVIEILTRAYDNTVR